MKTILIFILFVFSYGNLFSQEVWDNWKPYSSESFYEVNQNSQDHSLKKKYDIFNPRFYVSKMQNRFLSVDRFAEKYPSLTPYQYAANNPIIFIDVNGDSINVLGLEGKQRKDFINNLQNLSGYTFTISTNGNLIISSTGTASSQAFQNMITPLLSSRNIIKTAFNSALGVPGRYNSQTRTITLSDVNALGTISHELFHAFQHENNLLNNTTETEASAFLFETVVGIQAGFSGWSSHEDNFMMRYINNSFNFDAYNDQIKNFHKNYPFREYQHLKVPVVKYNKKNLPLIYNIIMEGK